MIKASVALTTLFLRVQVPLPLQPYQRGLQPTGIPLTIMLAVVVTVKYCIIWN